MNKTGIPSLHVEEVYEEEKRLLEISFFNPSKGGVQLSLFNSEGDLLLRQFLSQQDCTRSTLDITSLTKGQYTLHIYNSAMTTQKKILVSDWT